MRVAIIDDNNYLIKTIKEALSFFGDTSVTFTANDGKECLTRLKKHYSEVDIILMDIEMPVQNGIDTARLVKKAYPDIKIIMLTVFDNDDHIFNAIQAGADGYLLKDIQADALHDALLQTLNGGAAMTPSIAMKTLNLLRTPSGADQDAEEAGLTKRETEVLEQLATGIPYTTIATNLFISPSTVRRHIENIYQKLQVHSKLEAIQTAKQKRMI